LPPSQVGSCAALLAFIVGVIPHKFSFLLATVFSAAAAVGLLA
jgi:hypothetical protein